MRSQRYPKDGFRKSSCLLNFADFDVALHVILVTFLTSLTEVMLDIQRNLINKQRENVQAKFKRLVYGSEFQKYEKFS